MEADAERHCQPRSLEELLKWSLKLTDTEMKDWKTTHGAMTEERKDWLQQAMDHALENDEVKLMMSSIKVLRDALDGSEDTAVEEQTIALEQLGCLCDTIDMAKNLHKLGGFEVLLPMLQNEDSELRWRAAEVIAAAVQNNPFCQAACNSLKALPILIHLLRNDQIVIVKVKSLYALSRLVNNFDLNEEEFANSGGFKLLCELLASDHVKLRIKAAFMLRDQLLKSMAHLKDMLSAGIMMTLEIQLSLEPDESLEHLVNLVYEIVTRSSSECKKDLLSESLKTALHLKCEWMQKDLDKYQEEIAHIHELIALK